MDFFNFFWNKISNEFGYKNTKTLDADNKTIQIDWATEEFVLYEKDAQEE
jgi:dTDP-4-dehydrorhamnose 3,5-epimerase-like enzyme